MLGKISSGEWQPEMAIPTEQELTRLYGVAVGTVRKAVDALVNEGLLQRSQGRGTFVRRPSFDSSLFRFFRQVNEAGSQEIPQSLILARELQKPSKASMSELQLNAKEQAVRLERVRLLNARPMFHEEIWLPATQFSPLLNVDLHDFPNLLYPFYESRCGQRIACARKRSQ